MPPVKKKKTTSNNLAVASHQETLPFISTTDTEGSKDPALQEKQEEMRRELTTFGERKTDSFKDSLTMMSHPLFSFRPKKSSEPRVIDCKDYTVTLSPSSSGLPTYNDADILIYALSQIAQNVKKSGKTIEMDKLIYHSDIVFSVSDFFRSIGKTYGGKQQKAFMASLERLSSTSISISYERMLGGKMVRFEKRAPGFLENTLSLASTDDQPNPIAMVRLRLASWIVQDISNLNILTISKDYFELTPFAKALYLIARQHLGLPKSYFSPDQIENKDLEYEENGTIVLNSGRRMNQFYWRVPLNELSKMMGNSRLMRNFKQDLIRTAVDVDFEIFEIALTDTRRLKETDVVFFKKENLAANLAQATLQYAGFKEFYNSLITTDMLKKAAKSKAKKSGK